MSLIKPLFGGLGTASGFAWPLFGIVVSCFGIAAGGVLACILGGTAVLGFLTISSIISYQNYKNKLQELNTTHFELTQFRQQFSTYLQFTLSLPQQQIVLKPRYWHLLKDFFLFLETNNIDSNQAPEILLERYLSQFRKPPVPLYLLFEGFVGGFGTIAGGFAGINGLLMGVGVVFNPALLPILGTVVLSAAILTGFFFAYTVATVYQQEAYAKKEYQITKTLSKSLFEVYTLAHTQELEPTPLSEEEYTHGNHFFETKSTNQLINVGVLPHPDRKKDASHDQFADTTHVLSPQLQ